ncbi:MAG: heavy-metal-associated domain-containing protein [Acidimicrobiaceae bacterium]|nr:heavy-metal-associated domain-containing protein [Acidimicrobiaceae bacterium]
MTIENGLSRAEGITEVAVDVEAKTVKVTFEEPLVGVDALLSKLDDLGYPAHQG